MEAHNRFLNVSITGVTLLLDSLDDNHEAALRDLAVKYNKKIQNGDADLNKLEAFRVILCYEYQSLIKSRSGEPANLPETDQRFFKSAKNADVDIKSFFVKNKDSWTKQELALLYDILILQLVLHSEPKKFTKLFNHFHSSQQESLSMSNETQNLCMRISECFADTYNLQYYLYKNLGDKTELEEQCTKIQTVIKSWMMHQENAEWKLLSSLLPKLTIAFGSEKIVTPLWEEILDKSGDLSNTLTALCVIAAVCFPCETETVKEMHYKQCMQKNFWLKLLQGLDSAVFQHRKQALYLIKRAVDFMERHESAIKNELEQNTESFVPFVCSRLPLADPSIEQTKKNFFLILEVLEEKQKHLVLPTLLHLPSLVNAHRHHKSCKDCFNVVWLRCILRRILRHDNEAIKIFGLKAALEADVDIVDETFLHYLTNILNNTYLYANFANGSPEIVRCLRTFFERSANADADIINKFIRSISRVSWGSVALYWVLRAASDVPRTNTIVNNDWTTDEQKSVVNLLANSITRQCLPLRLFSQVMIKRILFKHFWLSSNRPDLELIVHALSLFPESDQENPFFDLIRLNSMDTKSSDATSYIIRTCDTFFATNSCMKSLAQMIAMLQYLNLIHGCTQTCPAEKALRNLFQNLIDADLRPYADPVFILKVLELMSHLISIGCQWDKLENMRSLKILMLPYGDAIIKLVSRSLERKTIAKSDEYFLAIEALINSINYQDVNMSRVPWWPDMEKQLERFEDKCIDIIANPNDFDKAQWSYAIKVLHLCREQTFSRRPNLAKIYIPPLVKRFNSLTLVNSNYGDDHEDPNGKIASECFETIAKLVCQVIVKSSFNSWPANVNWLHVLRKLIETESEQVIDPVASTLYELLENSLPLAIQDTETVRFIIRESARFISQLKRTQVFFSAVQQLTRVILNSNFFKLDGAEGCTNEYVNWLMAEAERVPTLKRIFITSAEKMSPQNFLPFRKSFISCLVHGKIPRRDQRIEQQAIEDAELRFGFAKTFSQEDKNIDQTVRAASVIVLLRLMKSLNASVIRNELLMDLLEILDRNKDKRYFDNSHLHMLKHRVMQTLLLLEPFLNEDETKTLHDAMCELLIAESNQPSVRLMQEWIVTRIHFKNSTFRDSIWSLFDTAAEKRPGSVVSLASIVFHVSRLLANETRTRYIQKAIKHLLSNGMSQQFNVRLYSQAIVVKILLLLDPIEATKYSQILEAAQESLRRGNMMTNSSRVLDNFYFTKFDPIKNYNLQTIYDTFPRLTNVSDETFIDDYSFRDLGILEIENILSDGDETYLNEANPMLKSLKATGELTEVNDSSTGEGLSDVQKKIIPWKSMVPFFDELSETSKTMLSRRKMQNEDAGIVVVASLVDRPPNLGGLARTCEIFGAKELIIGSLRYAEDREFQTLSVSAQKWITITEVKPHLLKNYLLEKQSEGWKLVGAEQTANSTNILEMKFDKKTILLLGNEKDGIPANLIPLLDTCVEIPQNGVVRSLNVHVSGAICIWQYATQHIFK